MEKSRFKNKKTQTITTIVIILIIAITFTMTNNQNTNTKVLLKTNQGDITINLYSDMPITTDNFKKLVEQGFYNNVIFHRVIEGFMVQGGDPTGTGMGGPGYNIEDEFTHEGGNKNNRGTMNNPPFRFAPLRSKLRGIN